MSDVQGKLYTMQEIADDIVKSNDNNGVAEALYKYVI